MAIHLDVQTQFDDRSVRSTADDLQKYLKRSGDSAGKGYADGITNSTPKIEKAMQKVADATGKVRIEQEKYNKVLKDGETDVVKRVTQYERLSKAQRDHASSVKAAANEIQSAMSTVSAASSSAVGSLTQLGTAAATLGRIGTPAALIGLGAAIVQVGSIAASASQSLVALPGVVGAVGTAFGTLKLATMGLDDAFKNMQDPEKFAESLRALAPNAQQAMLSIRNMLPALTQLQQATQNSLFTGVGQQLNQLANKFLPTIQQATTGVAAAFNQMFTGATNQLMSGSGQQAIQQFLTNVTTAFQQLAPAAAPLTQALADLMAAGSGALPALAKAATDAATSFAAFISNARASGQLQQWLSEGLQTIKDLTSIAWELGKAFLSLAPTARDILPTIKDLLGDIHTIMPLIGVAAGTVGAPIALWEIGIKNAAAAFDVVKSAANGVIPVINKVTEVIDAMLAPIRAAINVANMVPGVNIPQIPDIGKIPQIGGGPAPTQGGLPGAQAERRGGTSSFQLPNAGIAGVPAGGYSTSTAGGWFNGVSLPNAPQGWNPGATYQKGLKDLTGSGGASGGSARNAEGLVPNAAALKQTLQQMFPGITIGGYRANDPFPDHPSGEALDIMVGNNRLLGDQINRWLLQNASAFGLQYDLWQQAQWDPSGEIRPMADRGSPTANHRDHVHARVSPGEAANGLYMPLGATPYQQGGVQDVAVQAFGTQAQSDLQSSMGQMGAGLDQDFGISKGLPGLAENAVKFVGNLFFAPLLTALQALAGQNPNQGSGLLGMAASAGAFGPQYTPGGSAVGGSGMPSVSAMGPAALQPPSGWSADWNAIAQKESGGNWGIDTGNGYQGGLQFSPSSWQAAGGNQYAPSANLATPFQQAMTAENLLKMQGPGAWPNTFTPGSSGPGMYGAGMPTPGAGGGGGSGLMGMVGAQPQGMAYPSAGGAGFQGLGGLPMAALSTAASAVPGLGAAAQVGMQLANRVIAYGGQVAGIGISGLMETLSVGDNPMGSIGNSWLGKLAGGFAGARPALPNMAGKPVNAPQGGPQGAADAGAAKAGNTANITINNQGATPDQNGKDVAAHTAAMWAPAGRQ